MIRHQELRAIARSDAVAHHDLELSMFCYNFAFWSNDEAVLEALSRSRSINEFDVSGKSFTANVNFRGVLRYSLAEIEGQNHSMFVEPEFARSSEYKDFWAKLGYSKFDAREYRRIGRGGREIWIQASFNPVKYSRGGVATVVKIATDVAAEKLRNTDFESKNQAISHIPGVIEFTTKGEVIDADENSLNALGYWLDEIKRRHHRKFFSNARTAKTAALNQMSRFCISGSEDRGVLMVTSSQWRSI
jgi:methyl-accepting chemotaxis protein